MNWILLGAILLIIFLVAIFFISYVLNKQTPIPENCKDLFEEKQCEGCQQYSCAFNKVNEEIAKAKEDNK